MHLMTGDFASHMLVLINLIETHDLAWSDHGLKTTLKIMEGFGKENGNVQFEKT